MTFLLQKEAVGVSKNCDKCNQSFILPRTLFNKVSQEEKKRFLCSACLLEEYDKKSHS